jgi:hypothetical protein
VQGVRSADEIVKMLEDQQGQDAETARVNRTPSFKKMLEKLKKQKK